MAQFKYNGSDERVFPTISVTVNAGEIFEMITYYSYIYLNNQKYHYKFINYYNCIKEYLKENFNEYMNNHDYAVEWSKLNRDMIAYKFLRHIGLGYIRIVGGSGSGKGSGSSGSEW